LLERFEFGVDHDGGRWFLVDHSGRLLERLDR
jgi:hypothetical protein